MEGRAGGLEGARSVQGCDLRQAAVTSRGGLEVEEGQRAQERNALRGLSLCRQAQMFILSLGLPRRASATGLRRSRRSIVAWRKGTCRGVTLRLMGPISRDYRASSSPNPWCARNASRVATPVVRHRGGLDCYKEGRA